MPRSSWIAGAWTGLAALAKGPIAWLFVGTPIYVQRRELDDARSRDDYTIREWVDAPGVKCVPVDGELDEPRAEGQRLVRALDPELVWLSHEHQPWRSGHGSLS